MTSRRAFIAVCGGALVGLSANLRAQGQVTPRPIGTLSPFPLAAVEAFLATAEKRGYVTTLMGRRRNVPELRSGQRQRRLLGRCGGADRAAEPAHGGNQAATTHVFREGRQERQGLLEVRCADVGA